MQDPLYDQIVTFNAVENRMARDAEAAKPGKQVIAIAAEMWLVA